MRCTIIAQHTKANGANRTLFITVRRKPRRSFPPSPDWSHTPLRCEMWTLCLVVLATMMICTQIYLCRVSSTIDQTSFTCIQMLHMVIYFWICVQFVVFVGSSSVRITWIRRIANIYDVYTFRWILCMLYSNVLLEIGFIDVDSVKAHLKVDSKVQTVGDMFDGWLGHTRHTKMMIVLKKLLPHSINLLKTK